MDRLALADTVAPTDAFRSTNCPASIRSGSSMPLAEAIPCQSPPLPDVAAIDCTLSPCLALAKGRAPARETAPEPSKVETNIFCCDKVSVMLARNGLPSGEKNSSDSSKKHYKEDSLLSASCSAFAVLCVCTSNCMDAMCAFLINISAHINIPINNIPHGAF